MPNIGKPSGGCHACRRMRVKCDERKPGCLRCERGGRGCPGYRDESPIFHSMNEASEALALFPRRRRKTNSASISPHPVTLKEKERHASESPLELAKSLDSTHSLLEPEYKSRSSSSLLGSEDGPMFSSTTSMFRSEADDAIEHYFDRFVIVSADNETTAGFFECLPSLFSENGGVGYLEAALKSVALSAAANRTGDENLRAQARQSYGEALSQVKLVLDDSIAAKADTTLATLILLGQYEIISGERPNDDFLWMSHGKGLIALFELRGEEVLGNKRSRQLFLVAQNALQLSNCASHPGRSSLWHTEALANLFPSDLSRRLHDFNKNVYETHRETTELWSHKWRDEGWCESMRIVALRQQVLLDEGDQITTVCHEQRMRWLADSNISTAHNDTQEDSPTQVQERPPDQVCFPMTIITASNVLYFCAIRTKLLDGLLTSVELLEAAGCSLPPLLNSPELRRQLHVGIEDMLAAVPFMLGDSHTSGGMIEAEFRTCVGAYNALWPLHVLCSLHDLNASQRERTFTYLARISAHFEIRQASVLIDFWTQRQALMSAPHGEEMVEAANAGPGSAWFPLI